MHRIRKTQIIRDQETDEHSDSILAFRWSFVWKWEDTNMSHHFQVSWLICLNKLLEKKECNVENKCLSTFTGVNNQFWYFITLSLLTTPFLLLLFHAFICSVFLFSSMCVWKNIVDRLISFLDAIDHADWCWKNEVSFSAHLSCRTGKEQC